MNRDVISNSINKRIVGAWVRLHEQSPSSIAIVLDDFSSLTMTVDTDTDQLVVDNSEPTPDYIDICDKLRPYMGGVIQWVWIAVNNMGYSDCVCISVDGNLPNIIFTAVSSAVRLSIANEVSLSG